MSVLRMHSSVFCKGLKRTIWHCCVERELAAWESSRTLVFTLCSYNWFDFMDYFDKIYMCLSCLPVDFFFFFLVFQFCLPFICLCVFPEVTLKHFKVHCKEENCELLYSVFFFFLFF